MLRLLSSIQAASLCLAVTVFLAAAGISWGDHIRPAPLSPDPAPAPVDPVPVEEETAEYLTLSDGPANALASDSDALVIPDAAEGLDFARGSWKFDREFARNDGTPVQTSFEFDESGHGTSTITTADNERFTAEVSAKVEGGILKIETGRYTNANHKYFFPGMTIDCRNEADGALCKGSDGRQSWTNEHLLAVDAIARNSVAGARKALAAGKEQEQPAPVPPSGERDVEHLTLPDGPANALASGSDALVLPSIPKDLRFAHGSWKFDREFTRSDGTSVQTSFEFDESGHGTSTIITAGNERFTAKASARVEDGNLKIETEQYTNADNKVAFPGMFIECHNESDAALCKGSDGWKTWTNEHLLATDDAAKSSVAAVRKEVAASKDQPAPVVVAPVGPIGDDQNTVQYGEGGSEINPVVLENVNKATTREVSQTSPLQGSWRYSKDFARKSDGGSVHLEFHIDKDGKGHSVLKDTSKGGGEARANAEVFALPNGNLRVRTDAYTASDGKSYYPTFMECRPGQGKVLDCDVSNGWLRLNNGALVELASLNSHEQQNQPQELVVKPDTSSMEQILADLVVPPAPVKPTPDPVKPKPEPVKPKPVPVPPKKPEPQSNVLVLPDKDDASMSFLKGHWRCNTGLYRTSDNQPVVVEFMFDDNGKGRSTIRERSGHVFSASATATYKRGRLSINTSDFYAAKQRGRYWGQVMECTQKGTHALCSGHSRDGHPRWKDATFTRVR